MELRIVERRSARTTRRIGPTMLAVACATFSLVAIASAATLSFVGAWGTHGTASGSLNGPDNIAVDSRGQVFVADRDNNRIQKFSADGVFLARLGRAGGDGTAGLGNGEFRGPRGVTVDGLGNLFVADSRNNRIEKFDSRGTFIARFGRAGGDGSAGTGPGEFNDPRGLAADAGGNLYVADHGNNRIQKLSPSGRFLARWGRNGGDGSAGSAPGEFREPRGLAIDRAGNIFVADKSNNRIQKLSPSGHFLARWGRNGGDGSAGSAPGQFRIPYSVAVDRADNVFVADRGNNRVQELDPSGAVIARFGRSGGDGSPGTGPGEFRGPYGVATDCRSNLYVTDEGGDRVEKFAAAATSPAPICPASLTLGQPRFHRGRDHVLRTTVSCDAPCSATVRATITQRRRLLGGSSETSSETPDR